MNSNYINKNPEENKETPVPSPMEENKINTSIHKPAEEESVNKLNSSQDQSMMETHVNHVNDIDSLNHQNNVVFLK